MSEWKQLTALWNAF